MRKPIFLLIFAAVGLAYAVGDVWKTKPYQQWDASDLKQVLWNSPWVKYTSVPVEWKRPAAAPLTAAQVQGNQPGPAAGSSNGAYGNKGNSQSVPQVGTGQPDATIQNPDASFLVRWNSALAIREGLARQAVLDGKLSEAQALQYVGQAQPTYQVQVSGPDMTPFMEETSDTLKAKTYIEVKPSKKRVSPSAVEITKGPDGATVQLILFSFPRQAADGSALFNAGDKQAQFVSKLKNLYLLVGFDLRKMAGQNGPDL
ncbi:MAG: hypothetical protein WAN10_00450 [Candidatus Acidiferrales bacterium]